MTGADVLKEFINCECGDQCDCEVDGRDAMADEIARLRAERDALRKRAEAAEAELEIERMRLAACGVAALGYFNGCKDAYKSASLDDVLKLHAERDALRSRLAQYALGGGEPIPCAAMAVQP